METQPSEANQMVQLACAMDHHWQNNMVLAASECRRSPVTFDTDHDIGAQALEAHEQFRHVSWALECDEWEDLRRCLASQSREDLREHREKAVAPHCHRS